MLIVFLLYKKFQGRAFKDVEIMKNKNNDFSEKKCRKNRTSDIHKSEIRPQSPKTEFGFQNQYGRVTNIEEKNKNFEPQSPKTEFGAQNQDSRVIYLIIH
jgi:hypothetical protein